MVIVTLLPILIIGAIFVSLYFIQKIVSYKGLKFIFGAYLVILFSTVVLYYVLPTDHLLKNDFVSHPETKSEDEIAEFYNAANAGKLEEVKNAKIKDEWKFDYKSNSLIISDSMNLNMMTVFERKESDDGKVEVFHYTTENSVGSVYFTDKIKPLDVSIQGDQLFVLEPEPYEVNMSAFRKDFVVSQFSGKSSEPDLNSFGDINGDQILYFKIPKSLEIDGMENIQYIEE